MWDNTSADVDIKVKCTVVLSELVIELVLTEVVLVFLAKRSSGGKVSALG